jgi:aminoacyl-tRNA hydrolase
MSPVTLDGITFIRDDWKAPSWTIPSVLDFMRQARAERKVILFGTVSDTFGNSTAAYAAIARQALTAADYVIFVGPRSFAALRAKDDAKDRRLLAFSSVRSASDYLKTFLRPADLVLLKASNTADHLLRLILARTGDISCWRPDCGKQVFCDRCSWRLVPSGDAAGPVAQSRTESGADLSPAVRPAAADRPRVVVGFGNRGAQYQGTPHNVGQSVLDRLAATLGVTWTSQQGLILGRTDRDGRPLYLVKPDTYVNLTGGALKALADRLGFEPCDCLLVHDDLSLPLGTVRTRMRGSDGGHRGVRSVLETFQTDQFPRIKIGVGEEGQTRPPAEYVLTPFSPSLAALLDEVCIKAVDQIFWLLKSAPLVR